MIVRNSHSEAILIADFMWTLITDKVVYIGTDMFEQI